MKIAVSSCGQDVSSPMDMRFGRAAGFVLVDTESGSHSYIVNDQNLNLSQGAGIQSAQNVAAGGAQVVITGHTGPKAFRALAAGGIAVYLGLGGSVREAVDAYVAGNLQKADGPDKQGHW